jgi:hypothetical protein
MVVLTLVVMWPFILLAMALQYLQPVKAGRRAMSKVPDEDHDAAGDRDKK